MDYETFTREKIARLRAEADALEKSLKEFQAVTARASGSSRRAPSEGSAFGTVMEAIERSGSEGLTLDEMIDHASLFGFDVKRNTLRSQLWSAKNEGRIIQLEPGRYALAAPPLNLRDDPEPEGGGYSGEFRPAGRQEPSPQAIESRESFSADLDDEIPF